MAYFLLVNVTQTKHMGLAELRYATFCVADEIFSGNNGE